ncbi:MAG: uL15 family ribosomal protein [Minisyncoccia bacterium]
MQIHQLKPDHYKKNKKRIARGGKRGVTSGRGQKGQKSRAGHRIKKNERKIILHFPKLKGVHNKSIKPKPVIINVGDLEKYFQTDLINKEVLLTLGFIKKISQPVKILGKGEVHKSYQIKDISVSQQAKEKILKSGGTIL